MLVVYKVHTVQIVTCIVLILLDIEGNTLALVVAGGPAKLKLARLPQPHLARLPQCSSWWDCLEPACTT